MPTWPATLPQRPLVAGYGESRQSQVLRSSMDAGPPKVRRRFSAAAQNFNVQWRMDSTQLDTFTTFFDTDIQGGSLRFDIPHPRSGTTVSARFQDVYSISALGGTNWNVSATLEVLP